MIKWIALMVFLAGLPLLMLLSSGAKGGSCETETSLTGKVYSISQGRDLTTIKITRQIPVVIRKIETIPCAATVKFNGRYQDYGGEQEFVADSHTILSLAKEARCRME